MTTAAPPVRAVGTVATPLRPAITRPMLTVFVIGDVLGAGIYALVGEVAGKVGGAIGPRSSPPASSPRSPRPRTPSW